VLAAVLLVKFNCGAFITESRSQLAHSGTSTTHPHRSLGSLNATYLDAVDGKQRMDLALSEEARPNTRRLFNCFV
jgi:hypothetical protein